MVHWRGGPKAAMRVSCDHRKGPKNIQTIPFPLPKQIVSPHPLPFVLTLQSLHAPPYSLQHLQILIN